MNEDEKLVREILEEALKQYDVLVKGMGMKFDDYLYLQLSKAYELGKRDNS